MRNIVLTGFMGTGKTTIGKLAAEKLKFRFVDMDDEIEQKLQKSISQIFTEDGEEVFRNAENELFRELLNNDDLVIATGGGTLVNSENRAIALEDDICTICLTASSEEIVRRIHSDEKRERPLLSVERPVDKIKELLIQRCSAYDAIPWQINTDSISVDEIVDKIHTVWNAQKIVVHHTNGEYPIWIGPGMSDVAAGFMHTTGAKMGSRIGIVTNQTIAPLYLDGIKESLEDYGYVVCPVVLPDGEQFKNLASMEKIYRALVQAEFDRSDNLLALGGGVIGDMTGFAAATFMRGIRFVQVPTTLLSMVDASVGGKTGVDLVEGKNLVGCFKQPAAVFIDPGVLRTLPADELRSGMAELIKHGVIADESLFGLLQQLKGDYPVLWEKPIGAELIRHSLLVKTAIVEKDPFEKNIRAVLNLGHTTGHALETISNYRLKHGEGVGIGMMVACEVARRKNLISNEDIIKIEELLNIWGIPTKIPEENQVEKILRTMTHDKKKNGKKIKWVLPVRIGQVVLDDQVDENLVIDALVQAGAKKSS